MKHYEMRTDTHPCPKCGKPVVYQKKHDRWCKGEAARLPNAPRHDTPRFPSYDEARNLLTASYNATAKAEVLLRQGTPDLSFRELGRARRLAYDAAARLDEAMTASRRRAASVN